MSPFAVTRLAIAERELADAVAAELELASRFAANPTSVMARQVHDAINRRCWAEAVCEEWS